MLVLNNIDYTIKENNNLKNILSNINLQFKKNEITVITGANGSGKSTLIKMIMGIITPTKGDIKFNNKNINNLSISERANLGFTLALQQPVKFNGLTVRNLLDEACKKNVKITDACEYLSKVGLCAKNYINRQLDNTLSGGELKRIELAMALAKGGKVFLFDEPEAGIDLWSFEDLIQIFTSLKDKIVIIVSHQKKILEIADKIIVLNHNSSPLVGSKVEILPKLNTKSCGKLGGYNE